MYERHERSVGVLKPKFLNQAFCVTIKILYNEQSVVVKISFTVQFYLFRLAL